MTDLKEKMAEWRKLQLQADRLADEIKQEVLQLGVTIKTDGVVASYSKGRGRYNYQPMVAELRPPTSLIEKFTKPKIDWRKIAEAMQPTDDVKERYYSPGSPSVALKLKEE